MTQPEPPIVLDLDPSGYIQGLGQSDQATQQFFGTLRTAPQVIGPFQRGLDLITPKRASLAAMAGFTAVAARQQQQMSGLAASTRVTGQNMGQLTGGIREMARQMPVGSRGSLEMVQNITRLGAASGGTDKRLNGVSQAVTTLNKSVIGSVPGFDKLSGKVDSMFGTRGKVTDPQNERQVLALGRAFLKLGGATGEAPGQLAEGMITLNRQMGTGLGVKRVEALNDSLTTLSARSGASAGGILSFSKAIAPMAQASGIGQTQVMGISAAFSRLGEDGYGAANAFNKMLGDMHRSVREGTPEMAAYAKIVGQTTDQFQTLFKTNPSEALIRVVEAIGASGNAPRELETIGLEGVRNARVLTGLAQSGDLRTEISRSVGAYGNGSTEAASQAAWGGLNDSLVRLAENGQQAAEALGRPFLGAVTTMTNVMGAAVTPLRMAVDNRAVQGAASLAAYPALLGLLGTKVIGRGLLATGVGQMLTSGPIRGGLAGYASSGAPLSGLIGRIPGVAMFQDRVAANQPVGMGRMQGVNMGAYNRVGAFGRFVQATVPGTGPGLLRQAFGGGVIGMSTYMNMYAEQARLARTPFDQRQSMIASRNPATQMFMASRSSAQASLASGVITRAEYNAQIRAAFSAMITSSGSTSQAIRMLGGSALAVSRELAATGFSMAKRGLGMLAAPFGGPVGLALTAGIGGLVVANKISKGREDRAEEYATATNYLDDYRVAMGKATDATSTFAGRLTEVAKSVGNAPQSPEQARSFDQREYDLDRASGAKAVRDYGHDPARAVEMLRLQAKTSGLAPDEVNRIQQDLVTSGFNTTQINDIMKQLPDNLSGSPTADRTAEIRSAVHGVSKFGRSRGFLGYKTWADLGGSIGGIGNAETGDATSSGWEFNTLNGQGKQRISDVATSIRDTAKMRAGTYGAPYADEQMLKEMDAAVAEAVKGGDRNVVTSLVEKFQKDLGSKQFGISEDDLKKLGFSGVMQRENAGRVRSMGDEIAAARAASGGQLKPVVQGSWVQKQIADADAANPLADWFRNTGKQGGVQRAVQALVGPNGKPEGPTEQTHALEAIMQSARSSGMSMSELATKALEAANSLGGLTDANAQLVASIRAAAIAQEGRQANYSSSSDFAMTRGSRMAADVMDPTSNATATERQQSVEGLQALEQEAAQRIKARLTQQREQQVQETRTVYDYRRQQAWATTDFRRQMDRGEHDYQLQVTRNEDAYYRNRTRSVADYEQQVLWTTQDFNRQRLYAQRDFNKNLRRAAEDGARAMYDPYQRIQVQATWDARNLLGNLREQNEQIAKQSKNLGRLREMGGSSNLIKLLGLNDPKNAQQLANLVDDVARDPRVLGSLNNAAAARQQLGGKLTNDKDNTERARAIDDFIEQQRRGQEAFDIGLAHQAKQFKTQLARGAEDFRIAMDQMAVDHRLALARAAEDRATSLRRGEAQLATSLLRMHQDVQRADTEIAGDLTSLTTALNDALAGKFVDFQDLTKNGMKGWLEVLKQFGGDWQSIVMGMGTNLKVIVENGGIVGTGAAANSVGGSVYSSQVPRQATGGGDGIGMGYQRQAAIIQEQFPGERAAGDPGRTRRTPSGGISYHTKGRAVDITPPSMAVFEWIAANFPQSRELIYSPAGGRQLLNGQPHLYSGQVKADHYSHVHWAMAKGGIATGPTRVVVAEAGSPEAVIPLNLRGVGVLAQAMKQFVTAEDGRALRAAGGSIYVTYDNSSTHYDQRVIIEHVDLKAETPRELAQAAAAQARRDNLTAPPQRRQR